MKDVDLTLALCCQLQSVLHTIEDLSERVLYKHTFKTRTDNYYTFIEKFVENVTSALPEQNADNYTDIVKEIDKLVKQIKVTE
jgi:hypothetical protein